MSTLGTTREQVEHPQAPRLGSTYSREEVDAAMRAPGFSELPDERGIAIATEGALRVVEQFGADVARMDSFRGEVTVTIDPARLREVATFVRDILGFALLSDLSPCDWLDVDTGSPREHAPKRFCIQYICTKLVPGAPRIRLKVWLDEGETVESLIPVYPTADWHEREAYDFFGITFTDRAGLERIIMPDDWVGHPLRKDYPLGGEPVKFTNSFREA